MLQSHSGKTPTCPTGEVVVSRPQFKDQHTILFPPFCFFANFVSPEAYARNDLSFGLPSNSNPLRDKSAYRTGRIPVSVYKMDISPDMECDTNVSLKQVENPEKNCPLQHKPHPLKQCCAFRVNLLDERKVFLTKNGICYNVLCPSFPFSKGLPGL